ncbi:MAG TPA: murein biosynthesis integral membrane protein MurJ [Aggregatilineales bacterium]|nr:murein biosynthesis integral membrane protein MurJ [Anaerolineales bacterium]HRE49440.1 murein biosynthesis integral membrane protein MurJ [Aggregatilineales bacterium]
MTDAPHESPAAEPLRPPTAGRIARSAAMVIGILTFGKAFSLIEKWIGLDRFGVGREWDTFTAANQLPSQLYILISGGALAYAFIPIFSGLLSKGARDSAWKLTSNVVNTVFLTALFLSVIVFFTAPWLVANVTAPGFAQGADGAAKVAQTANLMRILLLSLILFSISGLVSGVLHTHQTFLYPALSPIFYDVGNLIGVAILARFMGIYGAAVGAVIGAALHLAIQIPGLIRIRARWQPYLNWRNAELRQVITLMIPRAVGLSLANLNLLVAGNIASRLAEGSTAAFDRGYALMQIPQTIIGTAMGLVIFPTLALLSARDDLDGKRTAMSGSLRFILTAAIPAAVLLAVGGRPFVAILEGGAFDSAGVSRVFFVLQLFALGIVTQSALEIVARAFYADKDMVVPLAAQLVEVVCNIGFAFLFVAWFQVAGLGLANSLAVGIELLILILVLRRRWKGIHEGVLLTTLLKTSLASAVMAAVMIAFAPTINGITPFSDPRLLNAFHGGVQLALGVIVFVGMAFLLRMREIGEIRRLLFQRAVKP